MKQLLSQNGIKIYPKVYKSFSCFNCGAVFISDEYEEDYMKETSNFLKKQIFSDTCFTCSNVCIIEEDNGKDKSI